MVGVVDPADGPSVGEAGRRRRARVQAYIAVEPAPSDPPSWMIGRLEQLCGAVVKALPAFGAGVSVVSAGSSTHGRSDTVGWGTAAASGPASRALDEMQFTFGEGPCIEAITSRQPVLEPDLAGRGVRRWPGYGPAAAGTGIGAVFAFPLLVGAAGIGALDVYRHEPLPLSTSARLLAATFADVALGLLLDGQAQAGPDRPAPGLAQALSYRLEVYQAQGMLMVDLDTDAATALLRLRAHAFTTARPLADVAADIVAGRIHLEPDHPPARPPTVSDQTGERDP